ncbi:MAG: threonylcarbamoyl-AMP synthase [Eubacterium sp.]|nr:threonylcarbamoyl-AMP synthase [Eubacterium sp.]
MNTQIIKITENHMESEIEEAAEIIRGGGLVAFPTETVYGLGGNALNPGASADIYAAKGRPSDNPLIVHVADFESVYKITKEAGDTARILAEAFWPGPLTMILPKSDIVPKETTGGLDTVAIRMPNHPVALELIRRSGGYIAAPSANVSGRPSPTTAQHVVEDMDGRIPAIIDAGPVGIGIESTIVDLTGEEVQILRPGYITPDDLSRVLGRRVSIDPALTQVDKDVAPKAPGMKYRHYAPRAQMILIEGDAREVAAYIGEKALEAESGGKRCGILCADDTAGSYHASCVLSLGEREDEAAIARHLFAALRSFDEQGVDVIYSECFNGGGIGEAVMNRLLKAAAHQVIKL